MTGFLNGRTQARFPKPGEQHQTPRAEVPNVWRRSPRVRGSRPLACRQGVIHQSTLEARRCDELHLLQAGELIRDLRAHPQVMYRLDVNGTHICTYRADFVYFDNERGGEVVEDTKGWQGELSKLKLKLMAACHGIDVELVRHAGKSRGWR